MSRPTVNDVIDDPKLRTKIEEIDRRADEDVYRLLSGRGKAIPRALWLRMKKRKAQR